MGTAVHAALARHILDLPAELWVEIIRYGDWRLTVACLQTCRRLNVVVKESAALLYEVELAVSAMQCGYDSNIGDATRLRNLQEHQRAWRDLSWSESSTPEDLIGAYLPPIASGGLLAHIKDNRIDRYQAALIALAVDRFPSKLRGIEGKHWEFILRFYPHQFDVDEAQDLAVFHGSVVHLHILQLSTGEPHPLNETHGLIEIPFDRRFKTLHFDTLNIYGNRFAIAAESLDDIIAILMWDWKTGERLADIPSPNQSPQYFRSFEFLDEEHIVAAGLDKDYLTANLLVYEVSAGPAPVQIPDGRCFRIALPPLPIVAAYRHVIMRRNVIKLRRPPARDDGLRETGAERMIVLQLVTTTYDATERDIHVPAHVLLKLFREHPPATVLPPSRWATQAVHIMEESTERLTVHRSMGMRVLTGPPLPRESDGRWVVRVRDYSPARVARAQAASMVLRLPASSKIEDTDDQKEQDGFPFLEREIVLPEAVKPDHTVACSLLENGIATFEALTNLQNRGEIRKVHWCSF
ncbi:hypothetical protein BC834DRAFT_911506 [Gloeopeniophorella convolvens]|nr:hypothetical protein BC834DRAFT_911506 [Gloeopeniophorella convolvens]